MSAYSCPECAKTFVHHKNLLRHSKEVHQSNDRPKCDDCGQSFSRIAYAQKHQCAEKARLKDNNTWHERGRLLSRTGNAERHSSTERQPRADQTSEEPLHSSKKQCGADSHTPHGSDKDTFKCDVCFQTFVHRYHLLRHLREQHPVGGRPRCDDCGKTFSRVVYANKHRCRSPERRPRTETPLDKRALPPAKRKRRSGDDNLTESIPQPAKKLRLDRPGDTLRESSTLSDVLKIVDPDYRDIYRENWGAIHPFSGKSRENRSSEAEDIHDSLAA